MGPGFIFGSAIVFWGIVLGGGGYAVRRFLRAYERRVESESGLTALRDRVTALEESMDSIQGSLERLHAGQEFTTRLLGARSGATSGTPDDRQR